MKNQASFSLKDKSKLSKCHLLQNFFFGAFRVKTNTSLCGHNVYLEPFLFKQLMHMYCMTPDDLIQRIAAQLQALGLCL